MLLLLDKLVAGYFALLLARFLLREDAQALGHCRGRGAGDCASPHRVSPDEVPVAHVAPQTRQTRDKDTEQAVRQVSVDAPRVSENWLCTVVGALKKAPGIRPASGAIENALDRPTDIVAKLPTGSINRGAHRRREPLG